MKILVAYDGSDAALGVLKEAANYAKAFEAVLCVVTSFFGEDEDSQEKIRLAEKKLEDAESLVVNEGIPCEKHLLIRGLRPGEDIIHFARENRLDLVFIGIKRRSKVGKLVFGSNAQYIILNSPCPVVSVK